MCYLVSTFCGKMASNEIADAPSVPLSGEALSGSRTQSQSRTLFSPAFVDDPLKEEVLKCTNWRMSLVWAAFTLAFFGFLRCSEFTYTKGFTNFVADLT